jgi:hypothetical protein
VSDKKPEGATEDDLPSVDTTNPILSPVETNPALQAVDTDPKLKPLRTITLDEDPPPAPGATQLLDPVQDVSTDPQVRAQPAPVQEIGESVVATQARKRKAQLKPDAFESAPSLLPAAKSDEVAPRGSPSPWKKTEVWTPGLIALTAALIFMLLVTIVMLLRS